MRDIPVFSTQLGVASLTLSQIPYTRKAYVRIQDTAAGEEFLRECASFCKMAGAEEVYATNHTACESYPYAAAIIAMQADKAGIGTTDGCLFPVTKNTLEAWREIYNQKVVSVPNGAWMTLQNAEEMLRQGSGYFIHRAGCLIGIGKVSGNQVEWVASVQPGGGETVVKALCHAITEDTVTLEVADTNEKAVSLYRKLGFVPTQMVSQWYKIG